MWSIFSSYAICSFNHHLLCKMVLSPVTTQNKKKLWGEPDRKGREVKTEIIPASVFILGQQMSNSGYIAL